MFVPAAGAEAPTCPEGLREAGTRAWGCGQLPCFHGKPARWGQAHGERAGPATLRTRMETFPKQALPAGVQPINLLWHKPFRIRFSVTCNQYSLEGPLARSQVTASPCDISCDLASEPPLTTPLKLPSTSPPRSLPVPVQPRTPQPLIPCSGPCLLDIRPLAAAPPALGADPAPGRPSEPACRTVLASACPPVKREGGALPFAGLPHSGNTLRGFRPQARASPAAYPARREGVCTTVLPRSFLFPLPGPPRYPGSPRTPTQPFRLRLRPVLRPGVQRPLRALKSGKGPVGSDKRPWEKRNAQSRPHLTFSPLTGALVLLRRPVSAVAERSFLVFLVYTYNKAHLETWAQKMRIK